MSLTAGEYNEIYSDELERSFDQLEGYEDVEERLGYYNSEQQITDDLGLIKNSVLEIYSSNERVDWSLIKPLKIKLKQLEKNLKFFENAQNNKQKVSTARINQTRELITQIGNLSTSSGEKLKSKYETGGLNQMKLETFNLFNSQVAKLSNIVDNLWESDNKISDLEIESRQLIKQLCNECDLYLERNRDIFNAISSKEERSKFVFDVVKEVIENGIGPSKFRIILGKKFDILDTIEEYSKTLYDLINDYGLKDNIILYFKSYFS